MKRHCSYSSLRALRLPITLSVILAVGGCAQLPRPSVVGEQQKIDIPPPPPPVANGAIYQPAYGYNPLFEDRRPRMVGDILTVVLDEQVSASKNSSANAGRDGEAGLEFVQLPEALEALEEYGFDVNGNNDFSGSGGAAANNSFTGTITVTVIEVLYNGNLSVRGEKQIMINQGTEFIRFSGVIDPLAVSDRNTVVSTEVADARIEYVGDGYINEAQTMGWLQRFFLNVSPF